ncbi:MAG: UDP-N-acetylmuramoyl-tripeptide--D-alanyl-D-alanine ligase [Anaerolineae bacterium]|nr:UDP-N-acetylmuramoyl-tripeptide--D-alanyl-D-alanine ligase [Anaerolineae bacterium]
MLTFADVIEALSGVRPDEAEMPVVEAAIDSRLVIPGAMFVALPGERADGHDYLQQAFERGAGLAIIQRHAPTDRPVIDMSTWQAGVPLPQPPFCLLVPDSLTGMQQVARFWRRKLTVRVIGITGSVGKSTSKELINDVLSHRFRVLKSPGNLNNEIGLPLSLLRLGEGYEHAVLEMGFYVPGEIAFLCDLALPQVGVLTNIGTVHAERAGSQEAIAHGKSELVAALPDAPEGSAILNYDDAWIRPMAKLTNARVLYYGLDPEAELWADDIESLGLEGIRFRAHYHGQTMTMRAPLIGRHSVHTALRAVAVGLVEGMSWQEIIHALMHAQTSFRLSAVHSKSGALILDDTYNASPESMMAALGLLAEMPGHRIAVLGDMLELGPYETSGHEMVGMRAAQVCDELLLVGERAQTMASAALAGGMSADHIHHFANADAVTADLATRLHEDDVVLVKASHGMRLDQVVASLEVTE